MAKMVPKIVKGASINDVDPFLGFLTPQGPLIVQNRLLWIPPTIQRSILGLGGGGGVKNLYAQYAPHFSRLSM